MHHKLVASERLQLQRTYDAGLVNQGRWTWFVRCVGCKTKLILFGQLASADRPHALNDAAIAGTWQLVHQRGTAGISVDGGETVGYAESATAPRFVQDETGVAACESTLPN